jgi:hypothetical protein
MPAQGLLAQGFPAKGLLAKNSRCPQGRFGERHDVLFILREMET